MEPNNNELANQPADPAAADETRQNEAESGRQGGPDHEDPALNMEVSNDDDFEDEEDDDREDDEDGEEVPEVDDDLDDSLYPGF